MSDSKNDPIKSGALSRRDFLNGVSAAALSLALTSHNANAATLPQNRPSLTRERMGRIRAGASMSMTRNDLLELPLLGDAAGWCQPEYYETIQAGRRQFPKTYQSADVDGD